MSPAGRIASSIVLLCAVLYWLPPPNAPFCDTDRGDGARPWRYVLITAPLFALAMAVHLFVATPVLLRFLGEDLPTEPIAGYLIAAWPAALIATWATQLLAVVPGLAAVVQDLHVMAFVAAIPIMVVLYTHEGMLTALTGSVFVPIIHPLAVGAALIALKVTSAIRISTARWLVRRIDLAVPGVAAWMTEARLATVLAPLFFAVPIFAFLVFIYQTHLASSGRP